MMNIGDENRIHFFRSMAIHGIRSGIVLEIYPLVKIVSWTMGGFSCHQKNWITGESLKNAYDVTAMKIMSLVDILIAYVCHGP
jgi:hypothetical protein